MDRQGLERSQAEIQNQVALLHQIAQAPQALQPLLLEQNGFGHIIPLLQEPVQRPSTQFNIKQAQTWDEDEAIAPATDIANSAEYAWLKEVDSAHVVLLWGPQGSGKLSGTATA